MALREWEIPEPRAPVEDRDRSIEAEAARLQRFIEIQLFRAQDADIRMLLQVAEHRGHRLGGQDDIAIDEKDIGAARFLERFVHQRLEADVFYEREKTHIGKFFPHQHLGILLCRAVGDEHFISDASPLHMLANRLQTEPQQFRTLVSVDSDSQFCGVHSSRFYGLSEFLKRARIWS